MKWIYAALMAAMTCLWAQSASAVFIQETFDVYDVGASNSYVSSLVYDTDTDTGQYSFEGNIFGDLFLGGFSAQGTGKSAIVHAIGFTTYDFNLTLDPTTFAGFLFADGTLYFDAEIASVVAVLNFSILVPGDPAVYSVCRNCYDHSGDLYPSFFADKVTIGSSLTTVPLPASLPLFAAALLGLGAVRCGMSWRARAAV